MLCDVECPVLSGRGHRQRLVGQISQVYLVTMQTHDAGADALGISDPFEQLWSFAVRSDHQEGVAP